MDAINEYYLVPLVDNSSNIKKMSHGGVRILVVLWLQMVKLYFGNACVNRKLKGQWIY